MIHEYYLQCYVSHSSAVHLISHVWISVHELSHKVSEVLDTLHWHSVVHRDSNTWAEGVTLDLYDTHFLSFSNEKLFQFSVPSTNSEDNVNSASPSLFCQFRFVVPIGAIDEVPKHCSSLVGKIDVSLKSSVLVHVCAVETSNVHWHDCWGIIVGIRRLLMELPVT